MKKMIKAFAAVILAAAVLSGCSKKKKVVDVSIEEGYDQTIEVGTFDASNYSIIETYNDGSTNKVQMTSDMISDYERTKVYQIGSQDITVVYLNTEMTLHLDITRAEFRCRLYNEDDNIKYLGTEDREDTNGNTYSVECYSIVYDGASHAFDIEGYYPKSTSVDYVNGNKFQTVGHYDCKAVLNADGYNTSILYASLDITPATYDMTGIELPEATQITYTEEDHVFKVDEDLLPEGVTVSYTINQVAGNTARDAGTYTVVATFNKEDTNYNAIPAISETYTIDKATYSTEEFVVGYIPDTKKVAAQNVAYTGEPIEFFLITEMPSWLTAQYINYIAVDDSDRVSFYNDEVYVKNDTGTYSKNDDGSFSANELSGDYIKADSQEYVYTTLSGHYISLANPYYIKVNGAYVNYYVKTLSGSYVLKTDDVYYSKNSRGEFIKSATGNYILSSDGSYTPIDSGIYYQAEDGSYALAEDTEKYVCYGDKDTAKDYDFASITSKHYIKASLDYFEVKEIGTYNMEIEFRVDNDNYNAVPNMTFEISIFEND